MIFASVVAQNRKNQKINKEIAALKAETQAFVESVLANPENAHLRAMSQPASGWLISNN